MVDGDEQRLAREQDAPTTVPLDENNYNRQQLQCTTTIENYLTV